MRNIIVSFLVLSLFAPFLAHADSASSTNFQIESGVIDIGGSRTTSTDFGVRSSLGQVGTGISSSTSFILQGGFLYFPLPVTATTSPAPTPTPAPIITGIGGGGIGFPATSSLPSVPPAVLRTVDLNHDGDVNITDLSILLYYYGQIGSQISRYDFDGDGEVDFRDISIMMFYWTG